MHHHLIEAIDQVHLQARWLVFIRELQLLSCDVTHLVSQCFICTSKRKVMCLSKEVHLLSIKGCVVCGSVMSGNFEIEFQQLQDSIDVEFTWLSTLWMSLKGSFDWKQGTSICWFQKCLFMPSSACVIHCKKARVHLWPWKVCKGIFSITPVHLQIMVFCNCKEESLDGVFHTQQAREYQSVWQQCDML